MYCPKCGAEITHYSKYCRKCGTKLPYDKEFEKIKSNSNSEARGFFTADKQIVFLCILGLFVIIMLSALAIGGLNNSPSTPDYFIDNFVDDVSAEDDGEVEYYYPSTGNGNYYNDNNDSKVSDLYNVFFSNDQLNQSG